MNFFSALYVICFIFISECIFQVQAVASEQNTIAQEKKTIVSTSSGSVQKDLLHTITESLLKGDYLQGKAYLSNYKKQYGEDDAYDTEYARLLALTGKSTEALERANALLKKDPGNATVLQIKAYALAHPEQLQQSPMDAAKLSAEQAERAQIDPSLFVAAAKAYLAAQDNNDALHMLDRALTLSKNDTTILYLRANVLAKMGNDEAALASYKKLYKQDPKQPEFLLAYARTAYNSNHLNLAAKLYTEYIRAYPQDKEPWLEAAYVQAFRGSFVNAISLLNEYKAQFGESTAYLVERARILAIANYPGEALSIVSELLPLYPDNYDLNYANTVALFYDNRPNDMFYSLKTVEKINPNTRETDALRSFVSVPYISRVSVEEYHSHDSQTVDIDRVSFSPKYAISPDSSILGDFYAENISASVSSGLNPIEGGNSVTLTNYKSGFSKQFSPHIALEALGGVSHVSDGRNAAVYTLNMETKWNDNFLVNLLSKEDYYDVSARAVSLGVKQNVEQANVTIRPCIQCLVNVDTAYSIFSDSNRMKYGSVNLLRNVLSTQWATLNFGLASQWQGFEKQLNNGYYSPNFYQYYGANVGLYIKQSDNIGYNMSLGLGEQKDDTFVQFSPANDYGIQGYFGIYRDWYLILAGGYSTRVSSSTQISPGLGSNYHVYSVDAKLTRRFF